ncbi:hypothetical protein L484_022332 [Morus notabilis]|uniref:Secreted protein n=1 Tax=Morus notabilis TaxID=981085 RepID=W9QRK8_9ROSA|nr:hypothetical protein L484_022332 [Morus notabilis]
MIPLSRASTPVGVPQSVFLFQLLLGFCCSDWLLRQESSPHHIFLRRFISFSSIGIKRFGIRLDNAA